ncbi:hypothetical protein [Actinokineospora sp. NBRC 105648]|uniref:hypothetical protein n=1 Tax=Actinokineospora sp. NBRC 105648 TaxID=3032206 RepID=UPI0024A5854B|nr:hypothetical protein [Actinokineospora sp. NBRC 105648]GLZ42242.1 hypothetical protein Acsp05_58660 [Actinokineospora sp. NBRC 105648]
MPASRATVAAESSALGRAWPVSHPYCTSLTIDRAHEEADRAAGTRLRCPVLVLWSTRDDLEDLHGDPVAIWRV